MSNDEPRLHDFAELIAQVISVDVDIAAITRDTVITSDLMIDSISLVSLIALSEERFGVTLADQAEAIIKISTVGDALDLIAANCACQPAEPVGA